MFGNNPFGKAVPSNAPTKPGFDQFDRDHAPALKIERYKRLFSIQQHKLDEATKRLQRHLDPGQEIPSDIELEKELEQSRKLIVETDAVRDQVHAMLNKLAELSTKRDEEFVLKRREINDKLAAVFPMLDTRLKEMEGKVSGEIMRLNDLNIQLVSQMNDRGSPAPEIALLEAKVTEVNALKAQIELDRENWKFKEEEHIRVKGRLERQIMAMVSSVEHDRVKGELQKQINARDTFEDSYKRLTIEHSQCASNTRHSEQSQRRTSNASNNSFGWSPGDRGRSPQKGYGTVSRRSSIASDYSQSSMYGPAGPRTMPTGHLMMDPNNQFRSADSFNRPHSPYPIEPMMGDANMDLNDQFRGPESFRRSQSPYTMEATMGSGQSSPSPGSFGLVHNYQGPPRGYHQPLARSSSLQHGQFNSASQGGLQDPSRQDADMGERLGNQQPQRPRQPRQPQPHLQPRQPPLSQSPLQPRQPPLPQSPLQPQPPRQPSLGGPGPIALTYRFLESGPLEFGNLTIDVSPTLVAKMSTQITQWQTKKENWSGGGSVSRNRCVDTRIGKVVLKENPPLADGAVAIACKRCFDKGNLCVLIGDRGPVIVPLAEAERPANATPRDMTYYTKEA